MLHSVNMSDSTNKQQLTVRLDPVARDWVRRKPNASRYIQGLVVAEMQMEARKPIVRAVKDELMADEDFFNELTRRLQDRGRNDPLVGVFD